VNNLEL